ncbi:hypothetical protein PoB_001779200 [Plakobranchus ocellatus]|uniref:Uncharacterized protein n=1 Tax=Plakobranchus ocellatus TaxID=259542 RepID=A0AAV3Z9Y6_9GAST|nr:hypothetical protein PoB_001779200 [Plakobranchus ocellatus]
MRLRHGWPCSPTHEAPAFEVQHFVTPAQSVKLQVNKGIITPGERHESINLYQKLQDYDLLTRADLPTNLTVPQLTRLTIANEKCRHLFLITETSR